MQIYDNSIGKRITCIKRKQNNYDVLVQNNYKYDE